jgi:hypothetical protein
MFSVLCFYFEAGEAGKSPIRPRVPINVFSGPKSSALGLKCVALANAMLFCNAVWQQRAAQWVNICYFVSRYILHFPVLSLGLLLTYQLLTTLTYSSA